MTEQEAASRAFHDIAIPEPASLRILEHAAPASGPVGLEGEVTLVVYGWHNVYPGVLHWPFPSKDVAVRAARALRNATRWAVVAGSDPSLERAREHGLVLIEQR